VHVVVVLVKPICFISSVVSLSLRANYINFVVGSTLGLVTNVAQSALLPLVWYVATFIKVNKVKRVKVGVPNCLVTRNKKVFCLKFVKMSVLVVRLFHLQNVASSNLAFTPEKTF